MGRTLLLTIALLTSFVSQAIRPDASKTCLPDVSERLEGYDSDSLVIARLGAGAMERIEGLWRFAADGGRVAIERRQLRAGAAGASVYAMVVVESPDRAVRPGTVMGYLVATARADTYIGQIYTDMTDRGTALCRPRDITLRLTDSESRFAIEPIEKGLKINLWRLLPYMFRWSVKYVDQTPRDLDGCVRLYPAATEPSEPRYL